MSYENNQLLEKKEILLKILKEAEETDLTFASEEKRDEIERTKKMYLQRINDIENQLKGIKVPKRSPGILTGSPNLSKASNTMIESLITPLENEETLFLFIFRLNQLPTDQIISFSQNAYQQKFGNKVSIIGKIITPKMPPEKAFAAVMIFRIEEEAGITLSKSQDWAYNLDIFNGETICVYRIYGTRQIPAQVQTLQEVLIPQNLAMDYHGEALEKADYDVMMALEHQIGQPIPRVLEIESNTFGYITAWKKVTALGVYSKMLKSLPENFGDLKSLEALVLNKNFLLTSLPESFFELKKLRLLDLKWNKFSSLPESFGNLKSLEHLVLNNFSFTSLPESFCNLKALAYLDLSSNRLNSLPDCFFQLNNLQELFLTTNDFSSLPENFGNLKSLKTLVLNNNYLTSLPESCTNLTQLTTLLLFNNPLKKQSKLIKNWLKQLKKNNNCVITRG